MACCCHFQGTKSFKLQKLTAQTAAKLYEYAAQWVGLKKEPEASLCKPFVIPGSENSDSDNHDNNNTTSSPDEGHEGSTTTTIHTGDQYIHQSCYSRITSTHKLDQAKKAYQEVSSSVGTLICIPHSSPNKRFRFVFVVLTCKPRKIQTS